jgi:phytoene dehydrogenase-like protein
MLALRLTAERGLRTPQAAAMLAGVAAHSVGPLPSLTGAATGLLLGHLAHAGGWPLPAGGSQSLADALIADLEAHGGRVVTGRRIDDLAELDSDRLVLADLGPREFLRISRGRLPAGYARALGRFRHGPGAAKTDLLLDSPVPWRDPELRIAGTVHLGGTREELYRAESETSRGLATARPFILVTEPANTDPGRAVGGRYPLWAYAHVPQGRPEDAQEEIIRRIEEHAPGFRDTIVAARSVPARAMEAYNPNYVGGDIGAGAVTIRQTLLRPVARWNPYATPLPGVFLCSASTPPGPGVHGMAGYLAARAALRACGERSPETPGRPSARQLPPLRFRRRPEAGMTGG